MRDLGCWCREELRSGCWKAEPLRGSWEVLLGSNTRSALESFSNRQRLDKKQECCPPGREESRVEGRRFITRDVSEIHYTPPNNPPATTIPTSAAPTALRVSLFPSFCSCVQCTSHHMTIFILPCKSITFIWVSWTSKHRFSIGCFNFWYLNNKELNLKWQIYSNKLIFSGSFSAV